MIPDHPQRDYRGVRVLVMGLGSFGGGLGAVKFFVSRGAIVTVTDTRPAEKLVESLAELRASLGERDVATIEFKLGGHADEDFRRADLIVVNPGIRRDHACLQIARAAGVPLTSEMNLFWQWNRAPVIAVTGSNGKSTTTALTHSILSHHVQRENSGRRCWLGGNIGISLLPLVDEIRPNDVVVLELSSFQLADLERLHVSPRISVVTNFSPNHLDWHDEVSHYRWSKQTMLRWQEATDAAVLNADDGDVSSWPACGERLTFGMTDRGEAGVFAESNDSECVRVRIANRDERVPLRTWLKLPGRHNLANAMAASCAALRFGADFQDVQQGIETYQPLPHRLQFVGEVAGRKFFNDSLATTPESAEVALDAFTSPIVLLAGGYDKQVDLSQMASAIARRVKAVALMGQTAARLRELITQSPDYRCVLSGELASFSTACEWAVAQSEPGDVVLLSPGCASYDWFRNFADRGQQFTEFVRSLETARTPSLLSSYRFEKP